MKSISQYLYNNKAKAKLVVNTIRRSTSATLFFICLMFTLFATSCNKFLDIQPEGELTGDELLKNSEGFETALYGVYATMGKDDLYGRNLSHNMLEVLAQSFDITGNDTLLNLNKYNYKFSRVESMLSEIWLGAYNNISNVNNVLKNLERFDANALPHYNLYKGEALGLRAFMHFDILRMYTENIKLNAAASGIPYATDFSLKAPDFLPLADVYTRIIADLLAAEQLLAKDQQIITFPKTNDSYPFLRDREIHFNLYAVQALLARVYLTKGDMPNALLYAEKVINAKKFQLLDKAEIAAGVMKGVLYPKEAIFGLYSSRYFAIVRNRFLYTTSFFSYDLRTDISSIYNPVPQVSGSHDYRWDAFFKLPGTPKENIRFIKLVDPYQVSNNEWQRPADLIKGINLIRLPEMYYIAAEAALGTNALKARDYFDEVLVSRGLVSLEEQGLPLTLDMITADRYKEFIGEGQTFFNMKRLNNDIYTSNKQVVAASKAVYVFPIPLEEFDYRK